MSLDSTLVALSDATRRSIVERLRRGPASVSEIAAPFAVSLNAVSKHIKVLEHAGLVRRTRRGRRHELRLEAAPIRELADWAQTYAQFWSRQLDRLEQAIRTRRRSES
jgi:DNA-binding transcriptional ArsR family regulator